MSGTLPSMPGFRSVDILSDIPILSDTSQSGKTQKRVIAGQLWRASCEYPPMIRAEFMPIYAFLAKQRGESFQVVFPELATPRGVGTGSPEIVGAHTVGDDTIQVRGFPQSQSGILLSGDVLKFGHSKVYMLTEDCDSDGSGEASLKIEPPLMQSLVDAELVVVNNVPFTMIIDNDVQEYKTRNPSIYRFSIDLVESL